jgi:predicted Zn-dependent peptidase
MNPLFSRLTSRGRPARRAGLALLAALALLALAVLPVAAATAPAPAAAAPAVSAQVQVESFTLDNGLTFLLVRKPELTTVAAGWVAHVGSANERPGITGLTHLFEHMMFKGSRTIGTTNIERDLAIIAEQEQLQEQIRARYAQQQERWRRGEIADPWDPGARTPELIELEKKFQALVDEQRSLMIKDEFDKVYTEAGGSGMNAFTNADMTVYFITVPANKLELWFWMESDRLYNLVPREFYSERDVVMEERRLRTESTPTGKFDEQFESLVWQSHPYGWPVVGWPSDLKMISKKQAEDYYKTYYSPSNITVAMVGNFDAAQVRALAQRYFGRTAERVPPPPPVVTEEMPQMAEQRMVAECDCQPQAQVAYQTVPFMHKDSYALDVLAGLMNGRTGRLEKQLVLKDQIAASASASQDSRKWAGVFTFFAETKGDATPEQLETAWYGEVARIQNEPIPAEELQKVKNQIAADAFRRLENPFFLMVQLLYYEGLGDWRYLNSWADRTLAVTADDVKRVATTYLTKENRTVGVYTRKAGSTAEPVPPELAALPPEVRQGIMGQARKIQAETDAAKLEQALAQVQQQAGAVPPEFKPAIDYLQKTIEGRLAELKAAGGAK